MNRYVQMLQEAQETHRQETEQLIRNRKPFDGLFGFASSVNNDACHDRFDKKVEEIIQMVKSDEAGAEEAGEVVSYILNWVSPDQDLGGSALNRIAAQRHCIPLIDFLSREKAREIASEFEKKWPRRTRLPVQVQLLKRLKGRYE